MFSPDTSSTGNKKSAVWAYLAGAGFFVLSTFGAAIAPSVAAGIEAPDAAQLRLQREQYDADRPKSIVELQQFRAEQRVPAPDGIELRLISLNPAINSWFLLEVIPPGGQRSTFYHLENSDPHKWRISLTNDVNPFLQIEAGDLRYLCRPWQADGTGLEAARRTGLPYAPVCDGRVYLRNRVSGSRTNREATVEFLRDNVWFGENIVSFIKRTFYRDAFLETGDALEGEDPGDIARLLGQAGLAETPVVTTRTGFDLLGAPEGRMQLGSWYAVNGAPGIYASMVQPGRIHPDILKRPGETNRLDGIESRADVYLVAFDLSKFEIGYETGTEHPRLGWSSRPRGQARDHRLPGPDGVGSPAPLAMTGMLSPALTGRIAAAFTGGYKRDHGAFKWGEYATFNHGNHYGFVVNGVVLSKLNPDLSTLYVLDDGTIGMKTWTEEDAALMPHIRFARQNGFPLIAPDPETGASVPGPMVRYWGPGNWSGSADAVLRTLRGGACMKTVGDKRFLIYAYFSTATPSAMARTFQAYGCDYAMLLDMNSPEHTYMALYTPRAEGSGLNIQHLVRNMAGIDPRARDGTRIPRFVGFSDNRDFFYLLRKEPD